MALGIAMKKYSEYNDEELQALAAYGDSSAEEQLAARYFRLVKVCARPYFLVGGDSEDLTQEGMFGLLSAIREYNGEMNTTFKTFAEQCIKNRLISAIRSASRKKHTPLNNGVSLEAVLSDEDQSHTISLGEAFRRVPEEQVLARESANEVFLTYSRCLSNLENQILGLFLDGLSYQEMGDKLGRSQKSVDNAVQRIRHKLAQYNNRSDISKD